MKKLFTIAALLACVASTQAVLFTNVVNPPASAQLSWDAVTNVPISNYIVYQGDGTRHYTNRTVLPLVTTFTATAPRGVTSYFAVTAFDGTLESDFSNEVSWTPKTPPASPNLRPPVVLSLMTRPMGTTGPFIEYATLPLPIGNTNQVFETKLGLQLMPELATVNVALTPQARALSRMHAEIQRPTAPGK